MYFIWFLLTSSVFCYVWRVFMIMLFMILWFDDSAPVYMVGEKKKKKKLQKIHTKIHACKSWFVNYFYVLCSLEYAVPQVCTATFLWLVDFGMPWSGLGHWVRKITWWVFHPFSAPCGPLPVCVRGFVHSRVLQKSFVHNVYDSTETSAHIYI